MDETTPITHLLSGLLRVGAWLLAASFLILTGFGLFILIPTEFQQQFFAGVDHTNLPATSASGLAIACFGGAIVAAAWFFVLKLLRKVVGTVIGGDPFVPENISRLRRIWVIIAAAEIFRMAVHWMSSLQGADGTADIDVRIGTWFLVFVIATLAEAFRYGAEMRREQELTI
jgi:hypothetical protein